MAKSDCETLEFADVPLGIFAQRPRRIFRNALVFPAFEGREVLTIKCRYQSRDIAPALITRRSNGLQVSYRANRGVLLARW